MKDLLPISPLVLPVMDTFFALLQSSGEVDELPDLLSVLGPEKTIQFIDIFGDSTFKVPGLDKLERLVRDAGVYAALSRRTETAASLAERHGLAPADVERIFERVARAVELYGI